MSAVFTVTGEGTSGAAVAAGDPGAPFTAVSVAGTGSAITYSNVQKFAAGSTSIKFDVITGTAVLQEGVTSGAGSLNISTLRYYRGYLYFTANPSASMAILRGRDSFGQTLMQLMIRSTGALELRNGTSTTGGYTGNSAVPLTNQWVRYLLKLDPGATSMTLSLWYGANINGTTPDVGPNSYSYTPVANAQAINPTSSGSLNRMDYGPGTGQANTLSVYFDGGVEDNASDPGPATNIVHTLTPASGITPVSGGVVATATGYGLPAGSRSWTFNWGDGSSPSVVNTATGTTTATSPAHNYSAVSAATTYTTRVDLTVT